MNVQPILELDIESEKMKSYFGVTVWRKYNDYFPRAKSKKFLLNWYYFFKEKILKKIINIEINKKYILNIYKFIYII